MIIFQVLMDDNLRESVSVKGQRRKIIDKMIKTKNGIELSPRGSTPDRVMSFTFSLVFFPNLPSIRVLDCRTLT